MVSRECEGDVAMSLFKDEKFVPEFVYRTQVNYYKALQMKLNSEEGKEEQKRKISVRLCHLERFAKSMEYSESDFYEVTQLINSLIGLLIFPEQAYFDNMSEDINDLKKFPKLGNYISDGRGKNFFNTYKSSKNAPLWEDNPSEGDTPRNIIRHLRNAVAHGNVSIFPINCTGEITHVDFKDEQCNIRRRTSTSNTSRWIPERHRLQPQKRSQDTIKKEEFFLRVSVDDLEEVLLEISEFLLPSEEKIGHLLNENVNCRSTLTGV